jgi:hypothetical protein
MSNRIRRTGIVKQFLFVFASFVVVFVSSCTKTSTVGGNILPANDLLNSHFSDTATVVTSIKLVDSFPTQDNVNSLYPFGCYNDPVFGLDKATYYAQLSISSFAPTATEKLDSVVLTIPFNTVNGPLPYYGTLGAQNVIIDTLTSSMVLNHTYYSDTNISHGTAHIGSALITPDIRTSDTLRYGSFPPITLGPRFRVKLNQSFGKYLINKYVQDGAGNFLNYIKGIYMWTSVPALLPGQGGLWYVNPPGGNIYFFYRDTSVSLPTPDTTIGILNIGNGVPEFANYSHDYSRTAFYKPGKDSIVSPNLCYVQALSGVKTQIYFPYLANWVQKNQVVVNKAELDIPINLSATGTDVPPPTTVLLRDSAGVESILADTYVESNFGGAIVNNQYVFDITLYVQAILDKKMVNTGLYLVAGNNVVSGNGAVLYGGAKTNTPRTRLRMYVTPLLK